MNVELLGFAVYVAVAIYLLLHNCTFNFKKQTLYRQDIRIETEGFLHLLALV